jgi:hypothetical protein
LLGREIQMSWEEVEVGVGKELTVEEEGSGVYDEVRALNELMLPIRCVHVSVSDEFHADVRQGV